MYIKYQKWNKVPVNFSIFSLCLRLLWMMEGNRSHSASHFLDPLHGELTLNFGFGVRPLQVTASSAKLMEWVCVEPSLVSIFSSPSFFFLLGPRMALTSPVTVRGPSWSSGDCRSVKLRFGFHVHGGLQSEIRSSNLEIIVGWTCICTATCILTDNFYCMWVQESVWVFLFSIICSVCGSHSPAGVIRNVSVPCVSSSLVCVSENDFLLNLQSVQTAYYPL